MGCVISIADLRVQFFPPVTALHRKANSTLHIFWFLALFLGLGTWQCFGQSLYLLICYFVFSRISALSLCPLISCFHFRGKHFCSPIIRNTLYIFWFSCFYFRHQPSELGGVSVHDFLLHRRLLRSSCGSNPWHNFVCIASMLLRLW